MPAPKGNKNAVGNKGGRPAVDLEQLAKDLVEWSYQSDALNLIGFSSPRRMSVTKLPHYASENVEFREALQLAKENISQNRFKAACAELMPETFFTRSEGQYDPLYRGFVREEKAYESSLRDNENKNKPQSITLMVQNDLAAGLNISTKALSTKDNPSSQ